jgi:hypothetical protein
VALVQPSAYPTSMYSSVQQPAEPAVTQAYGPTGEIPNAMVQAALVRGLGLGHLDVAAAT